MNFIPDFFISNRIAQILRDVSTYLFWSYQCQDYEKLLKVNVRMTGTGLLKKRTNQLACYRTGDDSNPFLWLVMNWNRTMRRTLQVSESRKGREGTWWTKKPTQTTAGHFSASLVRDEFKTMPFLLYFVWIFIVLARRKYFVSLIELKKAGQATHTDNTDRKHHTPTRNIVRGLNVSSHFI